MEKIFLSDWVYGAGALTFSDSAELAVDVLKNFKEIRTTEKKSFKAIMIDEFQDDNQLQRNLLFLLSEKPDVLEDNIPSPESLDQEKLFFVGDEKQSIYKFRGAEVSVFRQLTEDLNSDGASLVTNYRSDPALIAAFNTIFGGFDYPPANPLYINETLNSLIQRLFIWTSATVST